MATVAVAQALKLEPAGRLGPRQPLSRLLGTLGVLRATGVLELTCRKLVRKVILDDGALEALVSNAVEDRFADWLLGTDLLRSDQQQRVAALAAGLAGRPLTGAPLLAKRILSAEQITPLLRRHLAALLAEAAGWKDARYRIAPGRVKLGDEPRAGWPAAAAALELARADDGRSRRSALPEHVVARLSADDADRFGLETVERHVLATCAVPRARDDLADRIAAAGMGEIEEAVWRLWLAGLMDRGEAQQAERAAANEWAEAELGVEELERWLQAAEREDWARILSVEPGADAAAIRKAYYRTVRRFHPDRFREGPLASYGERVEHAFRFVQEALTMLTDPQARARRERERRRAAQILRSGTTHGADTLVSQARRAAAAGRRQDAVELLERAERQGSGDPRPTAWRCALLVGNPRRRDEALATLDGLCHPQQASAEVLAIYGLALRRFGRSEEAGAPLGRAEALDPTCVALLAAKGDPRGRSQVAADPFLGALLTA
jgi:Flp pilus assembly protein TadD